MDDLTKKILLQVGDGPEGIEIFTSEERAVVDWATDCPALYITVHVGMNTQVYLGPFTLSKNLIEQLKDKLKETNNASSTRKEAI